MLKRILGLFAPALLIGPDLPLIRHGRIVGRMNTRDVAFPYRMGAGMLGDVNRTHPVTIEPVLICAATPPTAYGQAVVVDATTQGVRPLVAGDQALTQVYGITVRPWPLQQSSGSNYGAASLGAATPPTTGVIDVMRSGYMIVSVVGQTKKGGVVYIWTSAASGSHVQGGFEAVNPTSDGMTLDVSKTYWNGVPDSSGLVEIGYNI